MYVNQLEKKNQNTKKKKVFFNENERSSVHEKNSLKNQVSDIVRSHL